MILVYSISLVTTMDRESRQFARLLTAVYLMSISAGSEGFFTLTNTPEIGHHKDLYIYAISSESTCNEADGTIEFNRPGGLPSEIVKTGNFTPSNSPFLGCYLKVGQSERYGSYRYGKYSASFIFNDDSTPLISPAFVKPQTEWLNTDGVYTVTIYPAEPGGTDLPCPVDIGVRYTPGCREIVWCRNKRRNVNTGPRLKLIKTAQAGLYTIFRPTRKNRGWFVQILVIAASCPKNYFYDGTNCVPGLVCKNGGVLKDKANACTCPPFFHGVDCGCAGARALADCGEGWTAWEGNCYQVLGTEQNWADAQASCQGMVPSSNLVSIQCPSEQDFIDDLAGLPNSNDYWIGLYDPDPEDDVLEYVDGTEYIEGDSYNNWPVPDQPDGSGDCVRIDGADGTWNDVRCSRSEFGICERPVPASDDCGGGWTSSRGSCYQVLPTEESWADAQASCRETVPQSNLVSIQSLLEQNFIDGILAGLPSSNDYWIGLYDPDPNDDVLVYVDGTEYEEGRSYNNWPRPGQPDGSGDCVRIDGADSTWNDVFCSRTEFGICERPAGEVIRSSDPISFTLVREGNDEIRCRDLPPCTNVKCRGLLVCHDDNYGCKCSSGWWGNACDRPCQKGRYGPDCKEYCPPDESDCNRFVGPSSNTECEGV